MNSKELLEELNRRSLALNYSDNKKPIVDGVYTFGLNTIGEVELLNKVLNGIDLSNKSEMFSITDNVLALPLNKQFYFLETLMEHCYSLCEESDINNVAQFVSQKCFEKFRNVMNVLTDDDGEWIKEGNHPKFVSFNTKAAKIAKLEEELGIKIENE